MVQGVSTVLSSKVKRLVLVHNSIGSMTPCSNMAWLNLGWLHDKDFSLYLSLPYLSPSLSLPFPLLFPPKVKK